MASTTSSTYERAAGATCTAATASMSDWKSPGETDGCEVPHRFGRVRPGQHGVHLGARREAEGQADQEPIALTVGKG